MGAIAALSAIKQNMAKITPARNVKILFFISSNVLVLSLIYSIFGNYEKHNIFFAQFEKNQVNHLLEYSGK